MKARDLKKKFIEFFKSKQHAELPNASLIPQNDPTVLFTTAGMHPLVPYLLGQPNPLGKRLVNLQKCLRTDDIEEVGDSLHLTFFEMLGNWSLGDYWKREAIEWSWEFLTSKKWLGLDAKRIAVSVFAGDKDAPRDEESARVWRSLGVPEERIAYLPKKDNWWGPAGRTGPCGPDTEMFYWVGEGDPKGNPATHPDGWSEIWNDVFMQYNKREDGSYEPLRQKNVDTGMGVERTAAVLQGRKSVYETELFAPVMETIRAAAQSSGERAEHIIADHVRAAVFVLAEGVMPSNVEHGYVLRKLIRRSLRYARQLGIASLSAVANSVIETYKADYPQLVARRGAILEEVRKEEEKFMKTLESGMRHFEKLAPRAGKISGRDAFVLYASYGFPIEMTQELAKERGLAVDMEGFEREFRRHQAISRTTAAGAFRSGLADASDATTRLHTATHLLNEALRRIVGENIRQRGSNITPERLRFDFNFHRKLTGDEIKKVEDLINKKIKENITVSSEEMPLEEALASGAQAEFGAKYPKRVSVYAIGNFSKEICTGPHVKRTGEIGKFRIVKQEAVAAGVRRIKAVVE